MDKLYFEDFPLGEIVEYGDAPVAAIVGRLDRAVRRHLGATRYLMKPPGAAPIGVSATLAGGVARAAAGEVENVATTSGGHGVKRQLPSDFGSTRRVSTM